MAQATATLSRPAEGKRLLSKDNIGALSIIASHSLQHAYTNGFYVILPTIYTVLGLTPVAAGFMEAARRVSSGAASMGGGLIMDQIQHRRTQVLYASLLLTGLGYLLVGLAPNYIVIVMAVAVAGMAGSLWHPPALSLLSQQFPEKRGFVVSVHRSLGNVGDTIGPLAVGGLLIFATWRGVLFGAFPLAAALAFVLWMVLRSSKQIQALQTATKEKRPLKQQMAEIRELFKGKGLLPLLIVAGVAGLAQGGLMMWLPLYLQEVKGMGTAGIATHVALLTGMGIASGPILGLLSDRMGRKPIIVTVLAIKGLLATSMALSGGGIMLTLLVAAMGAFMFGMNSLVQAAALDLADGKRVEGSMIGLLWGNNALFVGFAPVMVGFMVASLAFQSLFWYVAAMNAVAVTVALALPAMAGKGSVKLRE